MVRILLVDDDPHFRKTLRLALRSRDYEVVEAADGIEALDSVAATAPDLIVLDWHLPNMNGIETCRTLRARSNLPVIMVSANRSNSKQRALEAGANDYISKPFSLNDLLTRIEAVLER